MRQTHKRQAWRELDQLFRHGIAAPGDGVLLGRFLAERNELAFEALVARHGPMVLGVCRRLLVSAHDVDDAFQATFLVLVRKAGRLRDPERLGPWLYGVATRVAAKARARRPRHEPLSDDRATAEPKRELSDLEAILDAELSRLPAKHREVLVLCVLEGTSAEEASRRLGCPVGTVKSRLARGRETLRARLVRRGIAPALAACWALDPAPVPAALIRATLETIAASAVAPGIAALTQGATPSMITKSTLAAAVLVGGLTIAGLWMLSGPNSTLAQNPDDRPRGLPRQNQDASNNFKQILLAFHNFHSTNSRLPAVALYGADGQPKLSWRVALLPFLDQGELYAQFHLDEAWDSPHNMALVARMPAVFATPGARPTAAGQTRIRLFVGAGAAFEGTQGVSFSKIEDGTSNTLLLVVAEDASPWTKPQELPFEPGKTLPALEDDDGGGVLLGICDGSVRRLPKRNLALLPALITRAGRENIVWPPAEPAPAPAVPPALPTPAPNMLAPAGPSGPSELQSLDQRLRRVEEQLERILRRLDAAAPGGAQKK